jgi:four helix bundle protein
MTQPYQDLHVWQRAVEMSVAVYRLTERFPKQEMYGLTSQLQRASVSVASNIAEGRGRLTPGEFRQFLGMAQGSNYEVQTQLAIVRKLGFLKPELLAEAEGLSIEVGRMLSSLIATVGPKPKKLEAKS